MQAEEPRSYHLQLRSQTSLMIKLNLQQTMEIFPQLPIILISQRCHFLAVDLLPRETAVDGHFIPSLTQPEPRRSVGIACTRWSAREAGFRCRGPCWGWRLQWWCCWPPPWCSWWWAFIAWCRWFVGAAKDAGVVLRAEGRFGEGIVCRLKLYEADELGYLRWIMRGRMTCWKAAQAPAGSARFLSGCLRIARRLYASLISCSVADGQIPRVS